MLNPARTTLILLTVIAYIVAAPMSAGAQTKLRPPRTVQDDAGFFSIAAKAKANADIAEIKRRFKKDLLIETSSTTQKPKDLNVKDKKAVAEFFNNWAVRRFKNQSINGVYVVILKKPPILRVVVGNKTRDSGLFTAAGMWLYNTIAGGQIASAAPQPGETAVRDSETDVGEEEASVSGADYGEEDKYSDGDDADTGGWDDGGADADNDWGDAGSDW